MRLSANQCPLDSEVQILSVAFSTLTERFIKGRQKSGKCGSFCSTFIMSSQVTIGDEVVTHVGCSICSNAWDCDSREVDANSINQPLWARMYRNGEKALQAFCEGCNSLRVHLLPWSSRQRCLVFNQEA